MTTQSSSPLASMTLSELESEIAALGNEIAEKANQFEALRAVRHAARKAGASATDRAFDVLFRPEASRREGR